MKSFYIAKYGITQALKAASALSGVEVTFGHPGRDVLSESLFLAGTDTADEQWIELGRDSRRESYTILLFAIVSSPGDNEDEATKRVSEIYTVAHDVIIEMNPTRDLSTSHIYFELPFEVVPQHVQPGFGGQDNRVVLYQAGIRVKARTT